MRTRRAVLSLLGVAALAGCSGQAANGTEQAADRELSIAFDGLGRYEDAVRNAEPLEEASLEVTVDDVHQMLEETDSVEEEAEEIAYFAEQVNDENLHSILQEYHLEKTSTENQVVVNQNTHIGGRTGNVNEIYTVQNSQLQSQPILQTDLLAHTQKGDTIHKPGQQQPQELKRQRDDTDGARSMPQDYNAMESYLEESDIEYLNEKKSSPTETRSTYFDLMSSALFGLDTEEKFIFYDESSSNLIADAVQENNPQAAQALVELSNEYANSEEFGSEAWASAEYVDNAWRLRTHPDYQLGDKLPGER